jgi:hypothetical protein
VQSLSELHDWLAAKWNSSAKSSSGASGASGSGREAEGMEFDAGKVLYNRKDP